jgi:hypothetical protein
MRGSWSFAMKRILFTVSAIALALSVGTAVAADLPMRKEAPVYVPPPPPPMWTGFYVGLNIGGGWDANGGQSGYSAYYVRDTRLAGRPRLASRVSAPTCSSLATAIRSAASAASAAALRPAITSSLISS